MIIPIRTDSPLRRTPYANYLLIAVNVIAFIVQVKFRKHTGNFELNPFDPKLHQFITYQFLHDTGGVLHLLGNMLFLYIFGNNVNDRMGNLAYLAYYIAGGVFAGVTFMFLGADAPMIGASGAIAAVTGAFMVLFPRTKVTILLVFVLIGLYEVSSLWFILAFFLMDVGGQFLPMFGGSNVAYSAHIGGTVFGVVVCLLLLATKLLPRDMFDFLALIDRWNRRRVHRDLVSKGYDPFAAQPARVNLRAHDDPKFGQIQDLRASINESIAARKVEQAATHYVQLIALDSQQVMSRQTQLDLANELYHRADYANAAIAYESYLRQYSRGGESIEQIQLMLGLIYSRYLSNPNRARELLTIASERLIGERELSIARDELARLPAAVQ